ncbi:hypothetical protein [Edaphobacter dinghuensis]|uniref:Type IV secretion system protein VirB10 n=1 Tax=Edaphobacter dinghuensis TaxID=1560005 RepID=A0A917M968_9BACT|nr:hypothetical protein [Edaphobacter dinghuensis]GGG87269.1 hypothetical protein GCM10011585_34150 [Edaphobacter dinghuensis]
MNPNDIAQTDATTPGISDNAGVSELPRPQPPAPHEQETAEAKPSIDPVEPIREEPPGSTNFMTMDRKKAIILAGGLAAAVLFFFLTMMMGHGSHERTAMRKPVNPAIQNDASGKNQANVAPVMDALRNVDSKDNDGQLSDDDIKRMRSPETGSMSASASSEANSKSSSSGRAGTLASVPSFADTQQKWEDPRPYDQNEKSDRSQTQEQATIRETSLVFVRASAQTPATTRSAQQSDIEEPLLEVTPGSRIMAKLQFAISTADSAPVVAQVEYTYAIGDQIVVPAGALIYGHIEQADRVGYVSVKFDEIEIDHKREKVDAIGLSLDLGPIKGKVTGTNAGKNLLVRSVSGIGSTMAMVFGNNTSSAFSEDDLIRERLAENIGTAGDSEIMNLALTSKEVVTVDADTKIYVVFTKHEESSSSLHKVVSRPSM